MEVLPLVAGFVLAVLATLAIFLTDNPQYLRVAVLAAAWAFVLAALVGSRRPADAAAPDAGRGAELAELERAAAELGAAVGGDHAACSAGIVPWSRHIGLLGRQVAPRLYIAVETSGDYEHTTGSVKADVILVFKSSPTPVTGTADVAVAGDWRETLPQTVAALRGRV
jgi:hypothetical protein